MKYFVKYKLYLLLGVILGSASCERMNDLHDKYLQRGETTYLSRITQVEILPGNQRAKLRYLNNDPKAHRLTVYWRSKADSLVFPVPENSTGQELEVELPGLPEDFLTFELVTQTADGKSRSLPAELSARIYGERYTAGLNNRLIEKATYLEPAYELDVTWKEALENAVTIEIRYEGTDGKSRVLAVPVEEKSIVYLNQFQSGLQYRTGYVPAENAIDTFYTAFADLPFSEPYIIEGLAFNGVNQYMRIPDHADFNIDQGEVLSVSLWVKTSVGNRTQRVLAKRYSSGDAANGNTGYGIALLNSSRTYADWYYKQGSGGGGANVLSGNDRYELNKWVHLAGIFDVANKRITLYQDGELLGSAALPSAAAIFSISDVYVGWWKTAPAANPGEYFSGEIAHLRFWKKALSPEDIQTDMSSQVTSDTPGLVAAYDLRNVEGTGTALTVPDISGNHPAVLHGYNNP